MAASASALSAPKSEAKTGYRVDLALMNQNSCQAHNSPFEVSKAKCLLQRRVERLFSNHSFFFVY